MKAIKRVTTFIVAFALIIMLMPVTNVQAAITDIKIISATEVTAKQAEQWAKSKGANDNFIKLAQLYWKYAPEHGNVNPAIAYVQAAKEIGYGKFGGVLNESYNNPCGLKTSVGGSDSDPNAHQKFNTWDEGVQAHLDHLALYAGATGYPRSNTYDPRHFVTIKGTVVTVNALGGKWAPSLTYGEEINKLYSNLLESSGIIPESGTGSVSGGKTSSANVENSLEPSTTINTPRATPKSPSGVQATQPLQQLVNNSANISSPIGWKLKGSNWYYYKSNGTKATGWIKPDNNWYYLYGDGTMAKGWINLSGKWYYLKSSGAMQLGWLKDNSKWYYLQGDGSMTTGLNLIDGKKYFLDSSGAMRIGWVSISGQWYYFNTGGDMSKGWILDGNGYYYLNPITGTMVKNTVVEGWRIGFDGKRGSRVASSTSRKIIVIDPGHNFGGDDGAYATHNGITYSERDLNMQVADKLKAKLEAKGYTVIMTRNASDRETLSVTESLTKRVKIANNANANLFVSLHHNAASASASGVEVYYSSRAQDASFGGAYSDYKLSTSMSLAKSISSSLASSSGAINRGAKDGNLFVLRNTTVPAVLIERGFISNPDEARKSADSIYQDLAADAIANSIVSAI